MTDPRIHLAFRFHANFVHSYRGDTPDEAGFGQDIRIIRHLLAVLDDANAAGVPVAAAWDVDNHFSLAERMPEHCPDIIEAWQRRVAEGRDEIHVMSWNNALLSTHTAWEFDQAVGRALTNDEGSGLFDLFGRGPAVAPVVRPQEMMCTPRHLDLYRRHGLEAISLYYSAVPFNGFSNFVAPLSLVERFNPLTLRVPGVESTMTLVPAANHGDIAEQLSLGGWLRRLRRQQLALDEPVDLLVLIDADADDEFWFGYDDGRLGPVLDRLLPASRGLGGLLGEVAGLDFVTFTTPGRYLADHEPVGEVSFGQDTADGSFDGYASWAEKWSNAALWTGIERARLLEVQALRLLDGADADPDTAELLERSREARLLAMSTTNFGLASPVIVASRLDAAVATVEQAVDAAAEAFDRCAAASPLAYPTAAGAGDDGEIGEIGGDDAATVVVLVDHPRGVSTAAVTYEAHGSRSLVRLPLRPPLSEGEVAALADGEAVPVGVVRSAAGGIELVLAAAVPAGGTTSVALRRRSGSTPKGRSSGGVTASRERLANERLSVRFDLAGHPVGLELDGRGNAESPFTRSAVTYDGVTCAVRRWQVVDVGRSPDGGLGWVRMVGRIDLAGGHVVRVGRTYLVATGIPALHVDTTVAYPATDPTHGLDGGDRPPVDRRWQEVMPCELAPSLRGTVARPLRVWKHNALDHVSSYDLDHGSRSPNVELDSCNNHITAGWVAVSDQRRGLLVAQASDATTSFAFAPLRTRLDGDRTRVLLNPFGSYHGRQWRYPTGRSGVGMWLATHMDTTCRPHAPSYAGKAQRFSLLVAPYEGDAPPERLRRDAEGFASPPAVVVAEGEGVGTPAHRRWRFGEP